VDVGGLDDESGVILKCTLSSSQFIETIVKSMGKMQAVEQTKLRALKALAREEFQH
jgi:hypothetical protein